jgi:hypothetical protein
MFYRRLPQSCRTVIVLCITRLLSNERAIDIANFYIINPVVVNYQQNRETENTEQ